MMRNDRLTTKQGNALPRRNRFSLLAGGAVLVAFSMTGCSTTQEVHRSPKKRLPRDR